MAYTDINIAMNASAAINVGDVLEVTGSGTVGPASAGSTKVVGVAFTDATSGQLVTVATEGEMNLLVGTGGVTAGDLVKVGADGLVTGGTGDDVVGVALETIAAAASGRILLK